MHEFSIGADNKVPIKFSVTLLLAWAGGFVPLESGPIWIPAAHMHFGISLVAIGIVASMQFVMSALSALFIAPRIAGRTFREPVLVCLLLILLTSLAGIFLNPSFPVFVFLRAVDGAAAGLCIACCSMLANRTVRVARSFGLMQLGQIVGSACVFSLSAHFGKHDALIGVYLIISVVVALGASAVFFRADWPANPKNATKRNTEIIKASMPVLRITMACLGVVMIYCTLVALVTNANGFGARIGLTFAQVGIMLAISTPAGAGGSLFGTFISGRVPAGWIAGIATVGTTISLFSFGLCAFDFASLAASLCFYISFLYIGLPTVFAGIARLEPSGRAAATVQGAQMIGLSLGPIIGALIAQRSVEGLAVTVVGLTGFGFILAGTSIWIGGQSIQIPIGEPEISEVSR